MAELGLAIAGAVLAWKNILDLGSLIMDLIGDDDRERRGLLYNLQTKDFQLKEWGDYYGLDREDGLFHTSFEREKKAFLIKIIFRLHDSRKRALRVLQDKYGVVDSVEHDDDGAPDSSNNNNNNTAVVQAKRFARIVSKVKNASKHSKEKGAWLIRDQRLVTELINDADEQFRHLRALTFDSVQFLVGVLRSTLLLDQSFAERLTTLESRTLQENQKELEYLRGTTTTPAHGEPLERDRQTAVSYLVQTIISCRQGERVRNLITEGYGLSVDTRILEGLCEWWSDTRSASLVLETPYVAGDMLSAQTCAAVYYVTECHKLIYVVEVDKETTSFVNFADMLHTLIRELISLAPDTFDETDLPDAGRVGDCVPVDTECLLGAMTTFGRLVDAFVSRTPRRLLIIIDGLEDICATMEDPVLCLVRPFMRTLQNIIGSKAETGPPVKILLGCKGHASVLLEGANNADVLDVTDRATRTCNLMTELAVKW
ncbi:hypothetical protein LTS15_010687 [Exophiala xenobiotica]|nr:hypothetical protein LTS15_010687 [Exophiala xenobiotica]